MAYSIQTDEVIAYPPETLRTFRVVMYEWIDNLHFTRKPGDFLSNANVYVSEAERLFKEAGWAGDGEVELMWIPPFMLSEEYHHKEFCKGVVIWHVKQEEDGTSWILTPIELRGIA